MLPLSDITRSKQKTLTLRLHLVLRGGGAGGEQHEKARHLRRVTLLAVGVLFSLTLSRVRPLSSKACIRDMSTCPSSLVRPALVACKTFKSLDLFSPSICSTVKVRAAANIPGESLLVILQKLFHSAFNTSAPTSGLGL